MSFADLAAFPDVYDDRVVILSGFVHLEFEGDAIYPSEEAWRTGNFADAVWVFVANDVALCHQKHCTLVGTYDADMRGHFSLFRGSLHHVERVWLAKMQKPGVFGAAAAE